MANPAKILERGTDGVAFEALIPASQPGDVFPAGVIVDYAGSAAPTGWLICDGSVVSRATYPSLFANIGTTYGAGDGSTTFGLPDHRGRSSVGKHSSGTFVTLGAAGGEETHVLAANEMPSHNHTNSHTHTYSGNTGGRSAAHSHSFVMSTSILNVNGGSNFAVPLWNNGTVVTGTESADHSHGYSGTTSDASANTGFAGSSAAHNNMHPYLVLNKIIRAY